MMYIIMKYLLSFVLLLFFGLLQSTVMPINFLLILIILFAVYSPLKEGFVWAFIAGILRDLFLGLPLGLSGAFFLGVVFLLGVYGRKYKLSHVTYLLPFTIIALLALQFVFKQPINVLNIILSIIAFLFFLPLVRIFFLRFERDEEQLKLMEG